MGMLDKIKGILYNGYFINETASIFILKETGKEASCKEAHVVAKNKYLVYKFDQLIVREDISIKLLFPFFNIGNSQAMCDYVLFYENSAGDIFAVICNMKSKNIGNNLDQINAGINFSQFIFETAKRLYPNIFAGVKLNFVKILFSARELYSKSNGNNVINLISNDQITERLILENKCRVK